MQSLKGKVISGSSINGGPWTYWIELADDECSINATINREDEKVIGKPKPGDKVLVLRATRSRQYGYIITGRNGKIGPSERSL